MYDRLHSGNSPARSPSLTITILFSPSLLQIFAGFVNGKYAILIELHGWRNTKYWETAFRGTMRPTPDIKSDGTPEFV